MFEDYITTSIGEQYNIIGSIEAHEIEHTSVNGEASIGGGRTLLFSSTNYSLIYIGLTLNFIESWLKSLKNNYLHQTNK